MTDKTDNPIAKLGLKAYSGKLKGKQAVEISLKEQDAQFDSIKYESLTIIESGTGKKVARIPYNELSTFHVITGEGKRKAGVSFEHKPDPNKNGTNYVGKAQGCTAIFAPRHEQRA